MRPLLLLAVLLGPALGALAQEAGREATPAVVNPALRSELRQTMSLDGEWDFAVDPKKQGDQDGWHRPDVALPNKMRIRVPGCWEAQGVGGRGKTSVMWPPEQANKPLRGSYVGAAWYKKRVAIPAAWRGREIWLKVGGVNAQGWFWANGTFLNHDKSYCGAYKYRVTDLVDADGNLVIAAKARNDVPSGKGLLNYVQRFGGLYRSVELDATPSLLVDYAYVEGDFGAESASVHVTLRSTAPGPEQVAVAVTIATFDGRPAGDASKTVAVPAGKTVEVVLETKLDPFRAWSPEHPNLYRADIVLRRDGKAVDGWVERFGVRKWEVRGGDFYLNNHRHLVRGYGDDAIYPLTLVSPASRDEHRKHLRLARAFGFNYVRHHTHCELPEFFEAADEVGMMVQPELPYWGAGAPAGQGWFRPKEDLRELVTHYRRYVSLSTYCTGNEGHLGSPVDRQVYALARKLDPTRLFLHQDGGYNIPGNSDFGTGPANIWRANTIPDGGRAWFAHEYLNLAVSRDPRLGPKYTGAQLPPLAMAEHLNELKASGLDAKWGDRLLDSGHCLQRLWQKIGLETARLDTRCDGYSYWTIVDVDYAADQGLLDQFWGVKKATAEFFRQFNGPTAVLAAHGQAPIGADRRILADGDTLNVDWWISHFGEAPLKQAALTWRMEADGRALGRGRIENIDAAIGDVRKVGVGSWIVKDIRKPVHARLIGGIEGTKVENSWDLWLFPRLLPREGAGKGLAASGKVHDVLKSRYPGLARVGAPEAGKAQVLITDRMDGAFFDALAGGKSVVLVGLPGPRPGLHPGWWLIGHGGEQTGIAVADHPAFGDFPHQGYLNHLFFRLVNNTVKCRDEAYRGVEKLMVNRGPQGCLAHVFQAKAGKGKLFASGLNLLNGNTEAAYLLDQFIRYARSDRFQPRAEFGAKSAWKHWQMMRDLNGWSETVVQHQRNAYDSFLGSLTMDTARFSRGQVEVAWRTKPVPKELKADGNFTFKWAAALGWIAEPPAEFQLVLGDRKLLTFGVTQKETTWRSADGKVALTFLPMGQMAGGQDSSGIMSLTVPADMLAPGEKALLRVRAPQTGSQRWFGLYHSP
ncbi:MAG: sugar-binding domain-containing protein [Planctomycetota bacterium]